MLGLCRATLNRDPTINDLALPSPLVPIPRSGFVLRPNPVMQPQSIEPTENGARRRTGERRVWPLRPRGRHGR